MGKNKRPKRVLYIDDNNESKLLVTRMLEAEGCGVILSSDGVHGMELAVTLEPDIILVDLNLPFMDGYETATRLKSIIFKKKRSTPIIATSVYSSYEERDMSIAAGCDGFIPKPMDVDTFIDTLNKYYCGYRDSIPPARERDALVHYHQKLVKKLEAKAAAVLLDEDTGIYNEQYLYKRLDEEVSRAIRLEQPFSLVMIKVESKVPPGKTNWNEDKRIAFKRIADILKLNKRAFDAAVKMNDNSYCLILGSCPAKDVLMVAERVCDKLLNCTAGLNITFNFSIGTNTYNCGDFDLTLFLKSARENAAPFP